LDKKISHRQNVRDKALREKEELRAEQEKLENDLRSFLDEQELKYKEYFKPEPEAETIPPARDEVVIFVKPSDVSLAQKQTNVVVVESDLADLNLNADRNSNLESDRKTKSRNSLQSHKELESNSHSDSKDDTAVTSDSLALPPQGKGPKKTKKLVPSAFVPNRTLQLRRSGSLSSIDKSILPNGKLKPLDTEKEKTSVNNTDTLKTEVTTSVKEHQKKRRSSSSRRTPFY
jgi:hypothetical protein